MFREHSHGESSSGDIELLRFTFGGKWRLVVLQAISRRPLRLSELRRSIPGCSKKVLIDTLHDLESCGLVQRTDLSGKVRRVEYRIETVHVERIRLLLKSLGGECLENIGP